MPDATPTSIAPPSPARRRKVWVVAQVVVTAIVLWFVGERLIEQWTAFRGSPVEVHPRWGMIALSSAIVLATYAVLIETWRRIVISWGEELSVRDATAVWFVSNLVRYLPWNVVFQIGAIAELARRRRVSPATAAGAAVLNTIVNIATGFVVAVVAGFTALDTLSKGHATLGLVVAVLMVVGLFVLPALLPFVLGVVRRVTGRDLALGTLPRAAIYQALIGNLLAWAMYGLAFRTFVAGVMGTAAGSITAYIAIYASAYVIGYLALALPAGIGVREGVQINALTMLGLANVGQAGVIAVSSRLWLTILEVLPALYLLARGTRGRPPASTGDGANS
ncbi:MAG: lysylphosphatidylglycerol synthase domain-containing protein [Gemmatimonadaceae bacterium]